MDRRQVIAGMGGVALVGLSGTARAGKADALDALEAVRGAAFVAIGERHDNPDHHAVQARLVAALRPRGLAFEMIPRAKEAEVNRLRRRSAPVEAIGEALDWEESGWPDWSLYAPILEAAPDAYIAGGGLSREDTGRLYAEGASGLGPEMSARYGLDAPLSPEAEATMLNEQYDAHCGMLDRARLTPMVAVQRAWDAAYAEAWRWAGVRGGGLSVLICGNAHARLDRGAPAYLAGAVPAGTGIASIGQLEEGDDPAPDGSYTETVVSPRPERGDPCDEMRAAMEKSK